jgi:hypothetical protein
MTALKKLLLDHEIIDFVVLLGVALLVILALLALAESMSALFNAIGVSYDAQQAGVPGLLRVVFVSLAQITG